MTETDPVIAALLARPLRPRRGKRLSPLATWVEQHFAELVDAKGRADWSEIATLCNQHGMTDITGNPVTASTLQSAFSRIKARGARPPSLPFVPGAERNNFAAQVSISPKFLRKE